MSASEKIIDTQAFRTGLRRLLRTVVYLLVYPFGISVTQGQAMQEDIDLEQFVERIFANQDQDLNYEDLYESLYQRYLKPINLNRTYPEELQSTYLLSPIQITSFFKYLQENGALVSIYELQAIPDFDLQTIEELLPFVTIIPPMLGKFKGRRTKTIIKEKNNTLLIRYDNTLETKQGYTAPTFKADSTQTSRYLGSSDKIYMRYAHRTPQGLSLGLTAEKDAGEQIAWDHASKRYGADFLSFHVGLKNKGKLISLVVGDYQIQYGQSLVLGAGFSPGKGAETITTIKRGSLGVRPFTSVLESGFFRGIASTFRLGFIDLTTFYSRTYRDGPQNFATDTLDGPAPFISSIQVSGLHRTFNEIAARSAIKEQVVGGNVSYNSLSKKLNLGMTAVYTNYDALIKPKPRIYNQFEFRGKQNYNLGFHYSLIGKNYNLFGEIAISESGGLGFINGAIISLSKTWEMSLLYRRFERDFHTFYGAAFSENTRNINEYGTYLGIKYTPDRRISIAAYFDQFEFPWLKYRVNAPSKGTEILGRINYTPSKKAAMYGQFRMEAKAINSDSISNLKIVEEGVKQNFLFNLDLAASTNISLKSRVQFSNYKIADGYSKGFLIAQDLNVHYWKIKMSTRVALFDTDDYDTRQYVYERDVLYAFSIPAFYGRGIRTYILVQYNYNSNINFWIRLARTRYRDKTTIGSGLETIEGDTKTDVKFQIRYQF